MGRPTVRPGRPPALSGDLMEVQAVMLAAAEQARTPDLRFALRRHANRIRDIQQRLTDAACPLCGETDRDELAPARCNGCGAHIRDEAVA